VARHHPYSPAPPFTPPSPLSQPPKYTDLPSSIGGVTRTPPGVRVEGFGYKGSEVGISELCRTHCTYRQRSTGTCTRAVVRMRCDVTWLPLRGSVALRLARKIRLWLTEGSRVHHCPIDPGGGT
jgi:hypothetical protein